MAASTGSPGLAEAPRRPREVRDRARRGRPGWRWTCPGCRAPAPRRPAVRRERRSPRRSRRAPRPSGRRSIMQQRQLAEQRRRGSRRRGPAAPGRVRTARAPLEVAGLPRDVGQAASIRASRLGVGGAAPRARVEQPRGQPTRPRVDRGDPARVELLGGRARAHHGVDPRQLPPPRVHARADRGAPRRRRPSEVGREPARRRAGRRAAAPRTTCRSRPEPAAEVVGVDGLARPGRTPSSGPTGCSPPWNGRQRAHHRGAGHVGADPRAGVAEQRVGAAVGVERADRDDRRAGPGRAGPARRRRSRARTRPGSTAGWSRRCRPSRRRASPCAARSSRIVVQRRVEERVLGRLVVVAHRQAEHVDRRGHPARRRGAGGPARRSGRAPRPVRLDDRAVGRHDPPRQDVGVRAGLVDQPGDEGAVARERVDHAVERPGQVAVGLGVGDAASS